MRANPTVIGAFVVGALVLAFGSVLLFGSGDMFEDKSYAYLFFEEPVDGLNVGSPLKLHGVQIGSVVDVHLEWMPEKHEFRVPVLVEFNRKVGELSEQTHEERLAARKRLIDKGMRAVLETESFITGQLAIAIDYYPNEPAVFRGGPNLEHPEFPTVKAGLTKFLDELSKLPVKELFDETIATIKSIRKRVESDEVTRTLELLPEAIDEYRKLGRQLNERAGPLVDNIESTSSEAGAAFKQAKESIAQVEADVDEVARVLDETLEVYAKLGRDVDAEVKPTAEEFRDALRRVKDTLGSIKGAARNLEVLLEADSPTVADLNRALKEFADTMRAFRTLAETLDQQPEALLKGKR